MERMLASTLAISVLLLVMLMAPTISAQQDNVYKEFLELYERTAKLAKQGIDVSSIVDKLGKALEMINSGRVDEASSLLSEVREQVRTLEDATPRIVFVNNLVKWSIVALLASIPILLYFLLPRLYLYLWYRARRKWVVSHGSPR